jgi:hypothetical protein
MFEGYKSRLIQHAQLVEIAGWYVKVYTVTNRPAFNSEQTLHAVTSALAQWIKIPEQTSLPVYQHAFLIVHEAREGVWILFNWWTGGEMINRRTWFADFDQPALLQHQPQNDGLVCVWELEVIAHERQAWINHILTHHQSPDFEGYRQDVL